MKRILISLICLFWAYFVNAQVPQGYPSPSSTGFAKWGYVKTDSAGISALRDTNWIPKYVGSWVYWQNPASDSSFWVFNNKATGKKWDKVVMVSQGNPLGYVPYVGAVSNVNLNTHTLFAQTLGATDMISPSNTTNGVVYTNTSGNLTIDTADLTWNDVSKYFGIHTSVPNYPIDIHNNANNMLALNNTATGGAFMLYQTNGLTQWKTGYNSGTNSFDIQNVYSLNTALTFNTGTSLPTFYAPNILMNSGTDSASTKAYARSLIPSVRYPITSTGYPNITIGVDTGRAISQIPTGYSLNKVRDSLVVLISAGGFGTVLSVATTNGAGIISSVVNPTTSPNITIKVDTNRTVSSIITGGSLNKVRDSITSVTNAAIALKVNISDTAAMMSGYRRTSVGILNTDLVNSTISGTALGGTLPSLNFGTYLQAGATSYNGTTAVTMTTNATNSNLASTLVARDANGDFSARNITASLLGLASESTLATITNDASSNITVYPTWVSANTGYVGLETSSSKLFFNPSSGLLTSTSFAGNLSGNATTASTLQTPRTINGVAFDGSANISISASVSGVLSAGYGLTGSGYNGSLNYTWTADTTKVMPYTDTLAIWGIASKGFVRSFLSLTTTGSSGSATYSSNTGIINIPQYQAAYTNLTSIGSLANAAGVLYNNGTGTFSYTTTPTLTGTNFSGTAASLSIGGNAATATNANNATTWNGQIYGGTYTTGTVASMLVYNSTSSDWRLISSIPTALSSTITSVGTLATGSIPYSLLTGTPSLTGYVPYTGATGAVNLGTNTLASGAITTTVTSGLNLTLSKGTGGALQLDKTNATAQSWQISGGDNFTIFDVTASTSPFIISKSTGAATFSNNIQLGTVGTGTGTATPLAINLGSTFSTTAGSNLKLILFNDNLSNIYGLGVSSGQMDFNVPSGAIYKFNTGAATFSSTINSGAITTSGLLNINYASPILQLWNPTTSNGAYSIKVNASSVFTINNDYGGITPLTIASTGAATFSSTINTSSTAASSSTVSSNSIYTSGGIGVTGASYFASTINAASSVTASSLIKSGGTSSQVLMADGSVISETTAATASTITARDASGYIYAVSFFESSDARLKNIISRNNDMVLFKWKPELKRDNKTHIGYIAQEVQKVIPDAVKEDENGNLNVDYIQVLVKKVHDLEIEVKKLKERK